jgi:hemerythrin-like domain-containing protein
MTDRLKANLPRMLDEHKKIVAALDALDRAGTSERHPEAVEFAKHLREHAGTEEQVLYPAAILVGEYVNAKAPR